MNSKKRIVSMERNYPFGFSQENINEKQTILIKNTIRLKGLQRLEIKQKIKMVKEMSFQYLIRIQSIHEEEDSINLFYQYVPVKLQTWITSIDEKLVDNIKLQLFQLAEHLAQHHVVLEFKKSCLGINQQCQAKYFLGIDFEVNRTIMQKKLQKKYKADIENMLNFHGTDSFIFPKQLPLSCKVMDNYENDGKSLTKKSQAIILSQEKPVNLRLEDSVTVLKQEDRNSHNSLWPSASKRASTLFFQNKNNVFDNKIQYNKKKHQVLQERIGKLKRFVAQISPKQQQKQSVKCSEQIIKQKIFGPKNIPSQNVIKKQYRKNNESQQSKFQFFKSSKFLDNFNSKELPCSIDDLKNLQLITGLHKTINISQPSIFLTKTFSIDELKSRNSFNCSDNSQVSALRQEKRKERDYKLFGNTDKYCQEFMNFLEENNDDDKFSISVSPTVKSSNSLSALNVKQKFSLNQFLQKKKMLTRQIPNKTLIRSQNNSPSSIKSRVDKAIQESKYFINGLKTQQSQGCISTY